MSGGTRIRAAIIDDEPPARDRIRWLLRDADDVELVAEFGDVESAVTGLREDPVDLVFLDVRMPGRDGLELLAELGDAAPPAVIFVTAFDDYAVRAFELAATDYLLKPFDPERFRAALDRARRQLSQAHSRPERLDAHIPAPAGQPLDRLAVRSGGRILLIPLADVDWFSAEANYVRIHVGGRSYLLRETLTRLEQRLDPTRFVRIHRSSVVNLERIRELQPLFHGEMVVILLSGERLTLSRGYRDRLRGRWGRAV